MTAVMKYDIGEFKNVYRPRSFDYVVGQDGVKKFFINAFATDVVPQVLLFEGPKGTGKTTIARIVSMALNCLDESPDRPKHEPCKVCSNCKSILDDSNPDYSEINVADKTGVNDMRSLAEAFSFTPMYLKNKIYILDEAHQLSKAAQNKLLKDLEDTPDNVYIIFCTTDASSLIGTLFERCYAFKFNLLSNDHLRCILGSILLIEGRSIDDTIINLIIDMSEGSARRLLVNLHKVLLLGKDLSVQEVVNVLGSSAEVAYSLPKIAEAVLKADFKLFFKYVNKFNHKECYDLCFSLITYLGAKLRYNNGSEVSRLISYLEPCLLNVNKGIFINAVYRYINDTKG